MTQPINERPFGATDRGTPVRALPMESQLHTEPLPALKIWATYPEGSHPESVEIVYDQPEPVTVRFIAGILRALEQPGGEPTLRFEHSSSSAPFDAVQHAAAKAADSSARANGAGA